MDRITKSKRVPSEKIYKPRFPTLGSQSTCVWLAGSDTRWGLGGGFLVSAPFNQSKGHGGQLLQKEDGMAHGKIALSYSI